MGGRDLSEVKRTEILTLCQENRYSLRQIAARCGVSAETVRRIKRDGQVQPRRVGRCGRKRKTSVRNDVHLRRLSREDGALSAPQLQGAMATIGVRLSTSTIRSRLHEAGSRSVKPRKIPVLTLAMKRKRLEFARAHLNWTREDWRRVRAMFYALLKIYLTINIK